MAPPAPSSASPAAAPRCRLEIAAGARETEARLLELVGELAAAARRDPALLATPVRVVVPSNSLRLHVSERIATTLGATAGVLVQTLHASALEALERAGVRLAGGDALIELLARRHAREERVLSEAFAAFRDGYRTVAGTVRDLLDAGHEPELADALLERLGETGLGRAERERAAAVVRVAARVAADVQRLGLGGRAELLRRACEAFERDPATLPARALLVHGFADVTGRAGDWLEALARRLPGVVLLDRPQDPDEPGTPDLGAVFTDRLRERLEGVLGPALDLEQEEPPPLALGVPGLDSAENAAGAGSAPAEGGAGGSRASAEGDRTTRGPSGSAGEAARPVFDLGDGTIQVVAPPELLRAPGAQAEARAVARRVRALLDGARGEAVAPERIGIVARDLAGYRVALRTQLARLGVPVSGLRARAPLDGVGRRVMALVELFEDGAEVATDRWLDALASFTHVDGAGEPVEVDGKVVRRPPGPLIRTGLRVAGAARLDEVAELDLARCLEGRTSMSLPVRAGVAAGLDGEATSEREGWRGFHAPRLWLWGDELRGARETARSLKRRLEHWPARAPIARHLAELERLRRRELGWRRGDEAERRVRGALERLAAGFPEPAADGTDDPAVELTREELGLLVRRALGACAAPPLGGAGGGVAVLDAMEARGRTFDALFVVGLNRDVFPRVVREDPLLGDRARAALADVLPDVPIKARGRHEDRWLFAQLCSASPRVTLSWQLADDDGRPRVISPLVERLLGEADEDTVPAAPAVFPLEAARDRDPGPRTGREHAVMAGLVGERADFEPWLALALADAAGGAPLERPAEVAAARARVLAAFEEGAREPWRLAPWLGFLGAQATATGRPDPLVEAPGVTRLEAVARCGWQTVLAKLLKLEETADPLGSLPGIDRRVLGNLVHTVLQGVVDASIGAEVRALDAALEREPALLAWPEPPELERALERAARAAIEGERAPLPGHVRMLVEVARPLVETARAFLVAERASFADTGFLGAEVNGRVAVPRAEGELGVSFRADLVERREGVVVLTDFKTGKPKSKKELEKGLASGEMLQALAYAAGADAPGREVRGRYLFLGAETLAEAETGFDGDWRAHREDFHVAVRTLADAWLAGTFFPRLVDAKDKTPDRCGFCDVAAACLRGDTTARRGLKALVEAAAEDAPLRALFTLGSAPAPNEGERGSRARRPE